MMLEKVNEASKVTLYFLRESNSTFTMVVLVKGVFKLKPIAGIQFMLGSSGFYISPISVLFFCIFPPPPFFLLCEYSAKFSPVLHAISWWSLFWFQPIALM